MYRAADDSLPTRQSLLTRLRDLDDQESWRLFFDRYWRLLYNVARRAGLSDWDAQDVVQETVIAVARRMPGFHYDPQRGSFKQWLLCITHCRIVDRLRKFYRQPLNAGIAPEQLDENPIHAEAAIDLATRELGRLWDEEWERATFDAAVARVRREANPKHFQVFDCCVLKGWPVAKVAATLGLNAAQVYLAKHRVAQAVKRAARAVAEDSERGGRQPLDGAAHLRQSDSTALS